MSTPKQRSRPPKKQLHGLLQACEAAHRADIQTYVSGHLGNRSLAPKQLPKMEQSFWTASQSREVEGGPTQKTELKKDSLSGEKGKKEGKGKGKQKSVRIDPSALTPRREEGQRGFGPVLSSLAGLTQKDGLGAKRQSGGKIVSKRQFGLKEAAAVHEGKLEKGLGGLQGSPSRRRLAVCSDVLDDVCDSSALFGGILREIKTDYDLYINSILDWTALEKFLAFALDDEAEEEEDLEQAELEVSRVEEEIWRALADSERVQNELQKVQAMRDREERDDSGVSIGTSAGLLGRCVFDETPIQSTVQSKRLQLRKVCNEIQQMEKEMKEKMVTVVTADGTKRCVKEMKAEIIRLSASNDHLRTTNKDLERNIQTALNGIRASDALKEELWDGIWSVPPSEEDSGSTLQTLVSPTDNERESPINSDGK